MKMEGPGRGAISMTGTKTGAWDQLWLRKVRTAVGFVLLGLLILIADRQWRMRVRGRG
jgi:hypothetical protein